jgi:lipopolysaccharide/colanic/teichoic acid biosynthesis glycosyltransferase
MTQQSDISTKLLTKKVAHSKLKRLFDVLLSVCAIMFLSPFLIIISAIIFVSDGLPIFYCQIRVGRGNKDFKLFKFRTMRRNADKLGLLTVGGRDQRITRVGYFLRRYKLDELPQLFNVLFGSMSVVGPRPEVRKYVDLYNSEQLLVLLVKPGLSDYASLAYFSESELLGKSQDPEKTYVSEIMPAKLELNKKYILEAGLITDVKIIIKTLSRIFKK